MSEPVEKQIYYLESILRQLRQVKGDIDYFPSVGGEALYDNIDWLDCHIDALKKEQGRGEQTAG